MKLLIWVLIVAVVVMWVLHNKKQRQAHNDASAAKRGGKGKQGEPMLQCMHCGVHIPESESIVTSSGAVFCSEEHRRQHARS